MKTLLVLIAFTTILNFNSVAQRNTGNDRTPPNDRIDRINDGITVRNPDKKHEQIHQPYREKVNPTRPSAPQVPPKIKPICNPQPPIPIEGPEPVRPIYDSPLPPLIDTSPSIEELPLSVVLELGLKNLDCEIYNEAIKCFNILLDDDPLNYEYYCYRGRAYHGLELFNRAINDFHKSVKINKSYADGYYYLGLTELRIDNIDAAIVDFQIAADLGNQKAKQLIKKYFSR